MSNKQSKVINRAAVVDQNFIDFLQSYQAESPKQDLTTNGLSGRKLLDLFESQIRSRQLDLMARALKLENKVFYTIGSSGHEGNVMLGDLVRHTDPAFLHYRSGGLMMERARKIAEIDPIWDTCLSFAASKNDPASGGRHKVWGSKPLWVIPQTSTIASHLPKALGCALGIELAQRSAVEMPIPDDSIVLCNFGDASTNHSTAQGAFNAASWSAFQGLKTPILFVCEDNGIGISVKTPENWIAENFKFRPGIQYFYADGLDLENGYQQVKRAVDYCRQERKPVFLHLKTTRLMGHAGTDFEVDYRKMADLEACEAQDPLLKSAASVMNHNLMSSSQIIEKYKNIYDECMEKANKAHVDSKITTLTEVVAPLAPESRTAVHQEAARSVVAAQRTEFFGSEKAQPENQAAKHMAILINKGLNDLMLKYPETVLFGEDVAQKGGVYTITKQLLNKFGPKRIFNTLLDEQTILGLAQGYATLGLLPMPEIQYLAYFHNACDQIRGEAASLQFFSNGQFSNPMVVRIAGLGYQKGFGGHFHNDNSVTALRDIPGVMVACPSRGDDAVKMMRTMVALSKVNQRVSLFIEPIALYMQKDLYEEGDGLWNKKYPAPGEYAPLGSPRVYNSQAKDVLIITYGNGVLMSLRAIKAFQRKHTTKVKLLDLRWLQPLNEKAIKKHAENFDRIIIVDEGRRSACVGEGVITILTELEKQPNYLKLITGADSFTPLADAAKLVLPDESVILTTLIDSEKAID
ncbi:thiamine pyrophosphate-dependent enzyme [Marinicella sp. S1101]|uniref:thiamine pyrophosphate-dependent enzyme n=1 Tax=Marinicella marina TaxID=2996016 RepID=UPI0022608F02|nr:thiamine pyrophosphate-dependent enzyme [Marinicella marina]MCX7554151.1 thiamine pyrophosphate-dependent enzyme [Marinicella marina]MDJ1141156.1 thiamine pyrophosphate-dependent enzyme [Marinicella marina]